jgi:hypothetical protein
MKAIPLQLITVRLDNGQRGVFIGMPLVHDDLGDENPEISQIRFSDVEPVPSHLTIATLLSMIADRLANRRREQ